MNYIRSAILGISLAICSCALQKDSPKYQLGDGTYLFKQKGSASSKVYVTSVSDSLQIFDYASGTQVQPKSVQTQFFLTRTFDVDIMTVAFKYRPAKLNLPRQLDTDFNGNVYIGYRFDRFKVSFKQTPVGLKKKYSHRALTLGGFGGIGSTAMTPWTTNNMITDEYNGMVLTRGLALMGGINTLTVGVGMGWDYLTDRDKNIWIYQNKPWYGLTIGLNLN